MCGSSPFSSATELDEDDDSAMEEDSSVPSVHAPHTTSDYFFLLERHAHSLRGAQQHASPPATHAGLPPDLFNNGYYARFFQERERLGSGSFGGVYMCEHLLNDIHLGLYAVKKIPVGSDYAWMVQTLREVQIAQMLHHPNVVDYKHAWLEICPNPANFGPSVPCLFILMEYANAGNLWSILTLGDSVAERKARFRRRTRVEESEHIPEDQIWKFFIDICLGLAHLHKNGIVHCDLKPQNILLHRTVDRDTGQPAVRAMITDFGNSKEPGNTFRTRTGATGTLEFLAPELLVRDEHGKYRHGFSKRCDVWSLGVILYWMCFSQMPFKNSSAAQLDHDALTEEILSFDEVEFPAAPRRDRILLNLITALLQHDPIKRPTVAEVLDAVRLKATEHQLNLAVLATGHAHTSADRGFPEQPVPAADRPVTHSPVPSLQVMTLAHNAIAPVHDLPSPTARSPPHPHALAPPLLAYPAFPGTPTDSAPPTPSEAEAPTTPVGHPTLALVAASLSRQHRRRGVLDALRHTAQAVPPSALLGLILGIKVALFLHVCDPHGVRLASLYGSLGLMLGTLFVPRLAQSRWSGAALALVGVAAQLAFHYYRVWHGAGICNAAPALLGDRDAVPVDATDPGWGTWLALAADAVLAAVSGLLARVPLAQDYFHHPRVRVTLDRKRR